jgi:gliding motility-associated-like protein
MWTTSGTGTFNSINVINPIYTPSAADIASGKVTLSLEAKGKSTCVSATDAMLLSFSKSVLVNAGADASICQGSSFPITNATVSEAASLNWITSGTGTFSSTSIVNPVYTPSDADIAKGSVSLTLQGKGSGTCADASDTMILSISLNAMVYAGADASIGESVTYTLNGATASNVSSLHWITSGTGTFSNADILNSVYTPSEADMSAGSVTLTLSAKGNGLCQEVSDAMVLTLTMPITVNAGEDAVICEGLTYRLATASVTNSATVVWSTNGSGSFNNPNLINATYTPSAADLQKGQVTLTLTAGKVKDSLVLSFSAKPFISAGSDREACFGENVSISNVIARNYSGISWISKGMGEILQSNTLTPVYKPAANEAGDVKLIAIVTGVGLCSTQTVTDTLIIKFHDQLLIDAGESQTVYVNTKTTLSATVYPQGGNYTYSWSPAEFVQNSHASTTETTALTSDVQFVLTVTDANTGCKGSESVLVKVETSVDKMVTVRNGLSPNGDGNNDIWWVEGLEKFHDNEVLIFNRWGDKIIELRNYDNDNVFWDGNNTKGKRVPDGTYYYIIKINGIKSYTGWVQLRTGMN